MIPTITPSTVLTLLHALAARDGLPAPVVAFHVLGWTPEQYAAAVDAS